jgi:cytidine deaminase
MKASCGEKPLSKADLDALMRQARAARELAYAPYSGFPVGAAVLTGSGDVFRASNVENSSFGLSVCAERNAIAMMVASGATDPVAIAIAGPPGVPCPPCGACRQVLAEFNSAMTIVLDDGAGGLEILSLGVLFPRPFRMKDERA